MPVMRKLRTCLPCNGVMLQYQIRMKTEALTIEIAPIPKAVLIATIAFSDLIVSTIGLIQAKKNDDIETEMIKFANLSSALIGIALTQTAILSFTLHVDVSKYNGIGGMLFSGITSLVGIYMVIRGFIMIKNDKEAHKWLPQKK